MPGTFTRAAEMSWLAPEPQRHAPIRLFSGKTLRPGNQIGRSFSEDALSVIAREDFPR